MASSLDTFYQQMPQAAEADTAAELRAMADQVGAERMRDMIELIIGAATKGDQDGEV
jgi:hypothetical protein